MQPNECKWCGCDELITDCDALRHFRCGSAYWRGNDEWTSTGQIYEPMAIKCRDRMAAQTEILHKQVRHALQKLKSAERYDVEPYEDSVSHNHHDAGQQVDAEHVDQVIRILEGVSDDETE